MMMTTRRWRRRRGLFVFVIIAILENLRTSRRRRFAGAETSLRFSQVALNTFSDRVRAAEHAPRDGFYLLERSNGLALIVERGVGVIVEHHRVKPSHPERVWMTITESASRHGDLFAQQFLGFSEAL